MYSPPLCRSFCTARIVDLIFSTIAEERGQAWQCYGEAGGEPSGEGSSKW